MIWDSIEHPRSGHALHSTNKAMRKETSAFISTMRIKHLKTDFQWYTRFPKEAVLKNLIIAFRRQADLRFATLAIKPRGRELLNGLRKLTLSSDVSFDIFDMASISELCPQMRQLVLGTLDHRMESDAMGAHGPHDTLSPIRRMDLLEELSLVMDRRHQLIASFPPKVAVKLWIAKHDRTPRECVLVAVNEGQAGQGELLSPSMLRSLIIQPTWAQSVRDEDVFKGLERMTALKRLEWLADEDHHRTPTQLERANLTSLLLCTNLTHLRLETDIEGGAVVSLLELPQLETVFLMSMRIGVGDRPIVRRRPLNALHLLDQEDYTSLMHIGGRRGALHIYCDSFGDMCVFRCLSAADVIGFNDLVDVLGNDITTAEFSLDLEVSISRGIDTNALNLRPLLSKVTRVILVSA